jgi:hypothetical protein
MDARLNIHQHLHARWKEPRPASAAALPVRILLCIVGALAIAWAVSVFPTFWRQSPLQRTATLIMRDEAFKTEQLSSLLPMVEAVERAESCEPASRRNAVIIRLRLAEQIAKEQTAGLADQLKALHKAIRSALSCIPVDPFLWFALFRTELAINGVNPELFEYLRRSYRLGPHEGWIAVKRNYLALGLFEDLPPDLAELAVAEFAKLLNSGLYGDVLNILIGPGWRLRETLLAHLDTVAERHRRELARILYVREYPATVPGIPSPEPAPRR